MAIIGMKVVGIVGSPRNGSNSEILVKKVLEGASTKGANVEIFKINELNINWCQGCFECQKFGKCKQDDDMKRIYSALESADAVVIGSPIYMGYVTAQTKTFLDRLLALIKVSSGDSKLKGKKLILVYSQGMGKDGEVVMKEIGQRLSNFGMQLLGIIGENMLNQPEAVKERKHLLDAAFKLGSQIS